METKLRVYFEAEEAREYRRIERELAQAKDRVAALSRERAKLRNKVSMRRSYFLKYVLGAILGEEGVRS